jgi:thioredoxin reductase (NADPH)
MTIAPSILELQAFPTLSALQITRLHPFGETRATRRGDILFDTISSTYCLIVVLEGRCEILDRGSDDRILRTTGPGEFSGELGLLTGQRAFAACRVSEPGRVLVVQSAKVCHIVETIPELSVLLVTAFVARRQLLMRSAVRSLTIVGSDKNVEVTRLLEFADRNRVPYRWLDPEKADDTPALATCGFPNDSSFGVVLSGSRVIREATPLQLAQAIGLDLGVNLTERRDLIVVGAGPAGLAAATFGASEGLSTLVIEDTAIGGQAGTSSCIENYVGFPSGISGGDLAFRAEVQATKFGATMTIPRRARSLQSRENGYAIELEEGGVFLGRSIVIATGARYRRLSLAGQEAFEGTGIYYAATELEARRCDGGTVVVVGGGNSSGQAAMFLSERASCVRIVCRGSDLAASMSEYLVTRLNQTANVRIQLRSEVIEVHGSGKLESVTIANRSSGINETVDVFGLFVMIGGTPCTDWLRNTVTLDKKGFVLTGSASPIGKPSGGANSISTFSTDLPGVFAVGDVRSNSIKRVASAVGEGSVVIQAVQRYLQESSHVDGNSHA